MTVVKSITNFVLILYTYILLSNHAAQSQRISEACTTSKIPEDIKEYKILPAPPGHECFWIEAHSTKRKNGIHVTLFWNSDASFHCSRDVIKIKRIEMLVRGEVDKINYRYPIGEFSLVEDIGEKEFCSVEELQERTQSPEEYHEKANSSTARAKAEAVTEVLDCNGATSKRLYNGVSPSLMTMNFSEVNLTNLIEANEVKDKTEAIILACTLWEYKPAVAPTAFQKLYIDFTTEIEIETTTTSSKENVTKHYLISIGLKQVSFKVNSQKSKLCYQISGGKNTTGINVMTSSKLRPTTVENAPSEMCTCFRRPFEGHKKQITSDKDVKDEFEFSVHMQKDRSICVIFGLKTYGFYKYYDKNVSISVPELVIGALNDKGYPYGRWKLASRKECFIHTYEAYRTRRGVDFQSEEELYKENIPCSTKGIKANFLEPSFDKGEIPSIFYFYNKLEKGPVAVAVVFVQDKVFPNPNARPKHIQFIAEFLVAKEPYDPGDVYTLRSPKLYMEYDDSSNEFLRAVALPRGGNIYMDKDYYEGLDDDDCLPEREPPDEEPPMDDAVCLCFRKSRNLTVLTNKHLKKDCVVLGFKPLKRSLFLVTFEFLCEHEGHAIDEVIVQAVSDKGVPFGKWQGVQREEHMKLCAEGKHDFILRKGREPLKQPCTNMAKGDNFEPMHKANDPPEVFHYHNPNWGLGAGPKGRSGIKRTVSFCALWIFIKDPGVFKGYSSEFQFISHAVVNQNTMLTMRSPRYLFSFNETVTDKQIKYLGPSDLDNDVELKREYFQRVQKNPCLDQKPSPIPDEFCSCFNSPWRQAGYNQTDSEINTVKKCIRMEMFSQNAYSVTWALEYDPDICQGLFMFEVVFEALNELGMPTGFWENGNGDEKDSWLPEICVSPEFDEKEDDLEKVDTNETTSGILLNNGAKIEFPQCLYLPQLEEFYLQPLKKLPMLFHFKNLNKSEKITTLCAKWTYPTENYNGPYPERIQFYGQVRAFETRGAYKERLREMVEKARPNETLEVETIAKVINKPPKKSIIADWRSASLAFDSKAGKLIKMDPKDYEIKEDLDVFLNHQYYEAITKHYPCLKFPGEENIDWSLFTSESPTTPLPEMAADDL